jgi:adenylylsulfate kinase-like enzyme
MYCEKKKNIMNKIFALCGKPGSGKSYIANKIAKHYKSIIFSADKIIDLFNNPVGYFTGLTISRPLGCKIAVF